MFVPVITHLFWSYIRVFVACFRCLFSCRLAPRQVCVGIRGGVVGDRTSRRFSVYHNVYKYCCSGQSGGFQWRGIFLLTSCVFTLCCHPIMKLARLKGRYE
ncbi:hypothetical protein KC19_VG165400 [Ceratodon purpureus]|uniref:Secreted protein n=1 Tax=Ceratodon purpureus TaxID=3225 RepID=A0A8T0HRX4_CERPU|nr:hypothetical protein KC19_VG165400 [Ceratodon purpureus]